MRNHTPLPRHPLFDTIPSGKLDEDFWLVAWSLTLLLIAGTWLFVTVLNELPKTPFRDRWPDSKTEYEWKMRSFLYENSRIRKTSCLYVYITREYCA